MSTATRSLTWDEFLAMDSRDLKHAELIDGRVVVDRPTPLHQRIVGNLLFALVRWGRGSEQGGEAGLHCFVKRTDRRGYQPDLAWWPPRPALRLPSCRPM